MTNSLKSDSIQQGSHSLSSTTRDVESNRHLEVSNAYMLFTAICQGFCVMINVHVMFMLSNMAPTVLKVENFAGYIALSMEVAALVVDFIIFWLNSLKPWLTVILCMLQAMVNVMQIIVITLSHSNTGKVLYLIGTAMLGMIYGGNIMTSFAFIAFGPVNHLGAFSFGFAIGGVVPFVLSTILQNFVFTGSSIDDVRHTMYCIMGFVIAISIITAINLSIYFTRPAVKEHYERVKKDGISSVKCTLRNAWKGLKYAWRIVLCQFISYITILTFYPGIVPGSMNLVLKRRVMLVGVFQLSETFGRGIAVFIDRKYLPCNNLNRVIVLAICNISVALFLMCSAIFYDTVFMSHIAVITIGIITFSAIGGYCNSFADRSIKEEIPDHLEKEVIVSTTTVFKIIVTIFCALGSLTSTFLVPAIPKPPVAG
ncbi:nucleoside transporter [Babesia ovis]|uniref:Nucleoside transporter n=1 Tax=Babesia ovis TaxID=5869 RepID=A0A9W5TC03_BABOV|nr:nucleoside transporter [Babesia ovis]